MTDEPPAGTPARRARPPRGMRQAMLTGGDDAGDVAPRASDEPASAVGSDTVGRPSLSEALASIPDLEREPATGAWPNVEAVPTDHEGWAGATSSSDLRTRRSPGPMVADGWADRNGDDASTQPRGAVSTAATPARAPVRDEPSTVRPETVDTGDGTGWADALRDDTSKDPRGRRDRRRVPAARRALPWYRRALFGLLCVLLVGAIPVLAWVGVKLIRDSKSGTYAATSSDPTEPGYEALVEPTPTALVVQRNADGTPNALTFLALGNTQGGGSVMLIPLDTRVLQPLPGIDTLRMAYAPASQPAKAQTSLGRYTALTLGVGFSDTISIDDEGWEELLAKLAPIEIENPDAITVGTVSLPVGPVALQANQVGPYLQASVPGESDLNRLNRHEVLWRAIVAELAASKDPDVLPGETDTGLSRYLRSLADGDTSYQTMPVDQDAGGSFTLRQAELAAEILREVPFPQAPIAGARTSVRVLDGVSANPDGVGLTYPFVKAGATIAVVGNGPEFGRKTTVWSYGEERDEQRAVLLRAVMGGKGKIAHDPGVAEIADVSVVIGADLHDELLAQSASSAATTTTTPTTAPGGGGG